MGRRASLRERSSLEHVEFEVPDDAQNICPGDSWVFWPEPQGQRLDGPVVFAVAEVQGGVEAIDRGEGGPERTKKELSERRKLVEHCVGGGEGRGFEGRGQERGW